jgi:hypothetical protein
MTVDIGDAPPGEGVGEPTVAPVTSGIPPRDPGQALSIATRG